MAYGLRSCLVGAFLCERRSDPPSTEEVEEYERSLGCAIPCTPSMQSWLETQSHLGCVKEGKRVTAAGEAETTWQIIGGRPRRRKQLPDSFVSLCRR